jgi:hypothetical protein
VLHGAKGLAREADGMPNRGKLAPAESQARGAWKP